MVNLKMGRSQQRRSLGKIISVTADRFTIELNAGSEGFTLVGFDAQHYVARIGSFVLIPLQTEYVVAEVVGLREREIGSAERLETELTDSDALNSIKFLEVVPVGTLPLRGERHFRFGVSVYPPLYAEALYAVSGDLDRIFEVHNSVEPATDDPDGPSRLRAFEIGTSVVFDNYGVKVRIDDFFGGHSAILGNTGSGKSCTVASVVQSIFTKASPFNAVGASFLFLDTNGEYRQAMAELAPPIRRFYGRVPGRVSGADSRDIGESNEDTAVIRMPHWFLTPEEWELLLRASDRAQRPVLRTALGLTSLFSSKSGSDQLKDHVMAMALTGIRGGSESETAMAGKIRGLVFAFPTPSFNSETIGSLVAIGYGSFSDQDRATLEGLISDCRIDNPNLPDYQNLPFEFSTLLDALELAILYEEAHGNTRVRDYCATLLTRVKSICDRMEYEFMRPSLEDLQDFEGDPELYVEKMLGLARDPSTSELTKVSQITIIDMDKVEDEIVEVFAAVLTRLVFERLRRADQRNAFPVNLVLEEAHRYIGERPSGPGLDATRIFERVAREGRKYGLFLMIASQRPSELSRTVLSQCSNFVVHRIQNPEDLQNVRRMTPFISESVMGRLPSLPKQHALIFGNSVNVPTTFKVRDASPRPRSDDAQIGHLWFGEVGSLRPPL